MTEKVKLGYIRFGPIPKDERSRIGNGVTGDGYKCVGKEKGVSVWNAVLVKGKWCLVAPHGDSCTHGDFTRSAFPDDCLGCCKEDRIYLVDGDTDIAINIFDKGKCSDCSHILGGNAEIIGINKASIGSDVVELDIKI